MVNRSPLLTSGVLQLPQKMVHAVDLYHKEGQLSCTGRVLLPVGCQVPGPDTK